MEDMGMVLSDEFYTPPDLEDIFLNTCNQLVGNHTKCQSAWKGFTDAFGYKDIDFVTWPPL